MDDLDIFPIPLAISEKYVEKVKILFRRLEGVNLSKIGPPPLEEHKFCDMFLQFLESIKIQDTTEEKDFVSKVITIGRDMMDIINETLPYFKKEVESTIFDEECLCAKYFFVKRIADACYGVFYSLRMGTFDIIEESRQFFIVSSFAYCFCLDLMQQLIAILLKNKSSATVKMH